MHFHYVLLSKNHGPESHVFQVAVHAPFALAIAFKDLEIFENFYKSNYFTLIKEFIRSELARAIREAPQQVSCLVGGIDETGIFL